MGYVGRLLPMKGVDLLVKALADLGDVSLEIVGTGPEKGSLEKLARRLGVEIRVRFLGAMSAESIREKMATWDLLVLPSRTTTLWMEQLGRVLIEAMSLGVPVVAATTGSIPWVVGDAGILFSEDDLPGLKTAVRNTLDNSDETKVRVRKGRDRVLQEFTWPVLAERVTDFHSRLLYDSSPADALVPPMT